MIFMYLCIRWLNTYSDRESRCESVAIRDINIFPTFLRIMRRQLKRIDLKEDNILYLYRFDV